MNEWFIYNFTIYNNVHRIVYKANKMVNKHEGTPLKAEACTWMHTIIYKKTLKNIHNKHIINK